MSFRSGLIAVLLACVGVGSARGADWPQFLGPTRGGVSPETGLARGWPEDGPRVLWARPLAEGFAGPAVRDGQVYLLDRLEDRQDVLRCLDLSTGRELWTCAYDAPGTLPYNGSRQIPTVDEKLVFTVGPFGHVKAIDRQTRRIVWSAHLVDDFKDPAIDRPEPPKTKADRLARAQVPRWGVTQAPLVHGELLIVAPQTQKVGVVAYDKASGKLRWSSRYIGRNWFNHVSPALVTLCGVEQIIMLGQPSDPDKAPSQAPPAIVSAIDPATGQILWQTQTPRPYKIPIPQPVQIAPDRLLITGGHGLAGLVLKLRKDGDRWSNAFVQHNSIASYMHTPVVYKDHLYVQSHREHGGSLMGLVCLDKDLNPRWSTGPGLQFDFGNFILADGLVYALHGRTGVLYLLDADPAGYRVLAQAKVLDAEGATVWSPLALSRGRLLLRDQHELKCLSVLPDP